MSASYLQAAARREADVQVGAGHITAKPQLMLATNQTLKPLDEIIPQLSQPAAVDVASLPHPDDLLARLAAGRDDAAERIAALDVLCEHPSSVITPSIIAAVLPCLSDEDPDVTHAAVNFLVPLGSTALSPQAPVLIVQFREAGDDVRWRVAEVLAAIEPEALASHGDDVASLLGSANADVRRRAVELMGSFPHATRAEHASAPLPLLEDEDEDCRLSTVEFFGSSKPPASMRTRQSSAACWDSSMRPGR